MTSNPMASSKLLVHETRFAALLVHDLFHEGFSMRKYAGEKRLDDITQGRRESVRDVWQARRARRIHFVMYGEQDTQWAVFVLGVGVEKTVNCSGELRSVS